MHILHIVPYYAPAYALGGVVSALEGLACAQVALGHSVTVLTTDAYTHEGGRIGPAEEQRDGVRVLRAPNRFPALRRFNYSTPRGYARHMAQVLHGGVDVVHLHEFRTRETLIAARLAAEAQRPLLLAPHGTLRQDTGRSRAKRLWDALLSHRAARFIHNIVALNEQEGLDAQALWREWGLPAPDVSRIPNGVNAEAFASLPARAAARAHYGLPDTARVLLFMGRLHPRKGLLLLQAAFQQANVPDSHLLIVGPDEGAEAELRARADARTHVVGYQTGEARLMAYAAADAFALPATGEGFSMAALEALAAGLPALLSPDCHLPEVAEAGVGAIVPLHEAAWSAAIRAALSVDAAQAAQQAQAARALIQQHYTWASVARRMQRVYEAMVGMA